MYSCRKTEHQRQFMKLGQEYFTVEKIQVYWMIWDIWNIVVIVIVVVVVVVVVVVIGVAVAVGVVVVIVVYSDSRTYITDI